MFVDVKNLFVFVTDDEGKSYTPHKLGFQPTRLVFHPKKEDWILGYSLPDRTVSGREYVNTFAMTVCF